MDKAFKFPVKIIRNEKPRGILENLVRIKIGQKLLLDLKAVTYVEVSENIKWITLAASTSQTCQSAFPSLPPFAQLYCRLVN